MIKKRSVHIFVVAAFWVILWPYMMQAQSGIYQDGVVTITSNVIGANVFCDSVFLGVTPLLNIALSTGKHTIMVIDGTPFQWNARRKEQCIEVPAGSQVVHYCNFPSDSAANLRFRGSVQKDILVQPRKVEFHSLITIGGSVGIVCGIATAYFKIKADARYNDYLLTGDRESLRETHRFDTMAGVTLALSQIGLAMVTYCLLSE